MLIKRANGFTIEVLFFVFLAIVLSFSEGFTRETGLLSLPSGSRHILIFVSFFILFIYRNGGASISSKYFLSLIAVLISGLIPVLYSNVPLVNGLMGMFMTANTFLVYFLAKNSKFRLAEVMLFLKSIFIIFTISAFIALLSFIFSAGSTSMREHFGLFREAGAFSTSLNIAIIIGLFLYSVNPKRFYLYSSLFLSLIVMLTIIKKSMASTFMIWLLWFFYNNLKGSSKFTNAITFVIFVSFGIFLLYGALLENISVNLDYLNRVGPEGHVRIGMYLHAFQISSDHFPIGSGFGSFGSLASISFGYYSPVYYAYGTDLIGANSPADILRDSYTLLDTFWPHILAELGFIGSIFYIYLFFFPFLAIRKIAKKNYVLKPFLFVTTALTLVLFWEGMTLYHPETPFFIFLLGGIQGLIYSALNRYCKLSNA